MMDKLIKKLFEEVIRKWGGFAVLIWFAMGRPGLDMIYPEAASAARPKQESVSTERFNDYTKHREELDAEVKHGIYQKLDGIKDGLVRLERKIDEVMVRNGLAQADTNSVVPVPGDAFDLQHLIDFSHRSHGIH